MKQRGMNIRSGKAIVILTLALVVAFPLNAQSPMINYQGKVTDSDGVLLNGTYSLQFKIYNQETGGTALWTETQSSVVVENGIFNVLLGSTNPIPSNLFNGDERWLGVKVGTDPEMSPRQQIVSVGYALRSDKANESDDSDKLDNHDSNYFATADHNHDSEYVNEGQENSIDSTMILDSSISKNDCFFSIPDGHSLDAADGDPVDAVIVDNDGKIGMGTPTTAGQSVLTIEGGGTRNAISAWRGDIIVWESNRCFRMRGTASTAYRWVLGMDGNSTFLIDEYGNNWQKTANRFSLEHTSGNVGIGVENPSYPLHMGSGAYCTAGGTWTNASSIHYKENVVNLEFDEAMKAFEYLKPVKFNYKINKEEKHVGFIAEDVPELVASKDRKGLSSMDIVAVLTKVVQEQEKRIQEQDRRIEALEKDLEELKR